MEIIQEILHLVKKPGIESTGMFNLGSSKSLVDKYVNHVLTTKQPDDDKIAFELYKTNRSDPRYKNLKKRVKKKLIDSIPLIDKEYLGFKSEYNQVYYDCMEKANTVQLLSRLASYNTCLGIIKSIYHVAEKYQFFDILTTISYHKLRINTIKGNSKIIQEESIRLEKYLLEEARIRTAHKIYFQIIVKLAKNSSVDENQIQHMKSKIDKLEALAQESNSYDVLYWNYYVKITYLILIRDTEKILSVLKSLGELFKKWEYFPLGRRTAYNIQQLSILFQLKKYNEGILFAERNNHLMQSHQNNWSLFKRFEFYHCINIEYTKALKIYQEVIESDFFSLNNNERTSQLWLINHAYLQFLLNYRQHPHARLFSIYKFINEVGIYSKDKAGYNFSIFVIEMMFYLLNNDTDSYIERTTALMAYRLRHLNEKSFKRSNVFAKLLLDVEKHRFDPAKLKRSSQKKYDYLASLEDRLNINEWEIIGYETLWDIVLDLLQKRKS